MLNLTHHPSGVVLPVRAAPSARRNAICGIHDGMLKISVTAPPEDGRANAAIVKLLAKTLKISKSRIQLISGDTQRHKKFLLEDVDLATVASLTTTADG